MFVTHTYNIILNEPKNSYSIKLLYFDHALNRTQSLIKSAVIYKLEQFIFNVWIIHPTISLKIQQTCRKWMQTAYMPL